VGPDHVALRHIGIIHLDADVTAMFFGEVDAATRVRCSAASAGRER